jgi:hypothetical protein
LFGRVRISLFDGGQKARYVSHRLHPQKRTYRGNVVTLLREEFPESLIFRLV